mmetsp:Transcript_233/g.983  ORF Transcript_233/g.983 Transcript_233/m.983 type:complete len:440 (+) Transcript_233:63-1382(+)
MTVLARLPIENQAQATQLHGETTCNRPAMSRAVVRGIGGPPRRQTNEGVVQQIISNADTSMATAPRPMEDSCPRPLLVKAGACPLCRHRRRQQRRRRSLGSDPDVRNLELAARRGSVARAPVAQREQHRCLLHGDAGGCGARIGLQLLATLACAARPSGLAAGYIDRHDGERLPVFDGLQPAQQARRPLSRAAGGVVHIHPHRDVSVHASNDGVVRPMLRVAHAGKVGVDGVDATRTNVRLHEVHLREGIPVRGGLFEGVPDLIRLEEPECKVVELVASASGDANVGVQLQNRVQGQPCLECDVRARTGGGSQGSGSGAAVELTLAPGGCSTIRQAHVHRVTSGFHGKCHGAVLNILRGWRRSRRPAAAKHHAVAIVGAATAAQVPTAFVHGAGRVRRHSGEAARNRAGEVALQTPTQFLPGDGRHRNQGAHQAAANVE